MTIINNLGMFLVGIRDSLSYQWIAQVLFCTDAQTRRRHPDSFVLLKSLKSAFLQVIIFIFGIPLLLNFMGIYYIAFALRSLFLLLSYGYLFFYNEDIISSTRKILLWRQRRNPNPSVRVNFELDTVDRLAFFYQLTCQVKGFIFLLFYYVPILVITSIISVTPYLEGFGMFTVIISQAFFNSAFYFLSTWPYDKYNAAFIQGQKYYMLGYGMFVSILCNYFLSGFTSLGVCLIVSLWMLINSVIYSPVLTEFTSFTQIWEVLKDRRKRNQLPNAYNFHRKKVKSNQNNYRSQLIKTTVFLVNPALKITEILNQRINIFMRNRAGISENQAQTQPIQEQNNQQPANPQGNQNP